ncbi:RtcB family protein [Lachnospiraceae bacterium 29-84]
MKIVNGIYTSAKIFTDTIEDYAMAQIQQLCDFPAFQGCKIRVMPDVHPGKVGTIGFTAIMGDKLLPNVVGIDIGCGITVAKLKQKRMEFQKLDTVIRENVPAGYRIRKAAHRFSDAAMLSNLRCRRHIHEEKARLSLGTLGGGNHFIEIDQDEEGFLYAVIHSGSRHLGKEVTEYYLREGQKYLKEKGQDVPYELTYLEGSLMEDYIYDTQALQEFAKLNRNVILDEMAKGMKWKVQDMFHSVHNYIDVSKEGTILRKGAVSAREGEAVAIPINMRDGVLLGTGLGTCDWNYSAPHGAGRLIKREDVKNKFTVSDFKAQMKGIHCSCISKDTLDEAPFAYRGADEIMEHIAETVQIQKRLFPVYNFKAGAS